MIERHHGSNNLSTGFIKGFQIKSGAIATTVNHDSHNIIAIGSSDEAICKVVNQLIDNDGGIVVYEVHKEEFTSLLLPIAGLMTDEKPQAVSEKISQLKRSAKDIGCGLEEPFLTLSFMALPVIPKLKITDRGLINVVDYKKIDLISDK